MLRDAISDDGQTGARALQADALERSGGTQFSTAHGSADGTADEEV